MEKILLWIASVLDIYQYEGLELFLIVLVRTSLLSIVLAVALICFTTILKRFLTARMIYSMWLFLIVAMVLPLQFENRYSLSSLINQMTNMRWEIGEKIVVPKPEHEYILELNKRGLAYKSGQASSTQDELNNKVGSRGSISGILFAVWLSVVLILLYKTVRDKIRFYKLLSKEHVLSSAESREQDFLLQDIKNQLHIKKHIDLIVSDKFSSPAICSFKSPKLIIPKNIAQRLSMNEFRMIYMHELTHLKYYDLLIFELVHLLKIVYWFHPLVWFLPRKLEAVCESACDERVLNLLSEDQQRMYGATLIKSVISHTTADFPVLNANKSFEDMKRRIMLISNYKKKKTRFGTASAITILMLFAFVLIFGNPVVVSIKGADESNVAQIVSDEESRRSEIQAKKVQSDENVALDKKEISEPIFYDEKNDKIVVAKTDQIRSASDLNINDRLGKKCYIKVDGTMASNTYSSKNKLVKSLKVQSKDNITTLTITSSKYIALSSKEDSEFIYLMVEKANKVYRNIVVIDAGHGGADSGAKVKNKKKAEKDLTLELALLIEEITQNTHESGIKVYLVRSEDKTMSLKDRTKVGNELGGLYINLHYNYSNNITANGMEIYYAVNDKDGKAAASLFLNRLTKELKSKDNGIKGFDLYTLKNTNNPAISIELAYMSNVKDYGMVTSKEYSEKAAVSIINAAREYYGLKGDIVRD